MKKLLLIVLLLAASPSYAQILLKQSTATTVNGKLTKIADGTDHTGLTVTSITAKIIKQSDTLASTVTAVTCAASGSANDCVEVAAGVYNMELSASNTDTLGRLDVCMLASGDYTDCVRYEVVPAGYYDFAVTTGPSSAPANFADLAITASTGYVSVGKWLNTAVTAATNGIPDVNVKNINNVSGAGITTVGAFQGTSVNIVTTLATIPKMYLTGTAQSGTSTTIVLASATSEANDSLNGSIVKIMSGTGLGQSRRIIDYVGSTDTATIAPPWTTNPGSDSVYEIVQMATVGPPLGRAEAFTWVVQMRKDSDNSLITTGTPTCTIARDSATFGALTNAPSALNADGESTIVLTAADVNATDFYQLKCTLATARTYYNLFKVSGN